MTPMTVAPFLSVAQLEAYRRNGYLLLPGFLTMAATAAVRAMLESLIVELVAQSQSAEADEIYRRSVPIDERGPVLQFEHGAPATETEPLDRVRKVMNFQRYEPVASLAGPGGEVRLAASAIAGDDPIMLHSIAQLKPPRVGREKRWHQDNAYFSVAPLDAVLGIWIALHDTDAENGCLHVIHGGHRLGPVAHVPTPECCIPAESLPAEKIAAVPMRAGDALLFQGLLPHSSPPNLSARRRWSLAFHYRTRNSDVLPNSEFEKLFVDREGRPAGCAAAARRASPDLERHWRD